MTLVKPSFVEAIMLSLMKNSNNCYLIEWYMLYGKICNEENPLCYSIETGFTTMFATCATQVFYNSVGQISYAFWKVMDFLKKKNIQDLEK